MDSLIFSKATAQRSRLPHQVEWQIAIVNVQEELLQQQKQLQQLQLLQNQL